MAMPLDVLVFEVDGRRYGLPVSQVRELQQAVTITPLPGTSPDVRGVVNVRGTVLPVWDIRTWFGLPAKELEYTDHLVIAEVRDRRLVLRVDRATELLRLEPEDVVDAGGILPGMSRVTGVAKLRGELVSLLDLGACVPQGEVARPEESRSGLCLPRGAGDDGSRLDAS